MFESHYYWHTLVSLVAFVCLGYIRLARAVTYSGGIPRVGGSGVARYIATALRYTFDAESVILDGKTQFLGRPFVIPTLVSILYCLSYLPLIRGAQSGPIFFLGPEYLESVRSSSDDIVSTGTQSLEDLLTRHSQFNEPMAVSDDLQLPYTMDVHQMENPYQATVMRTDVNRAIPTFIPEILEESILAMDGAIGLPVHDGTIAVFF